MSNNNNYQEITYSENSEKKYTEIVEIINYYMPSYDITYNPDNILFKLVRFMYIMINLKNELPDNANDIQEIINLLIKLMNEPINKNSINKLKNLISKISQKITRLSESNSEGLPQLNSNSVKKPKNNNITRSYLISFIERLGYSVNENLNKKELIQKLINILKAKKESLGYNVNTINTIDNIITILNNLLEQNNIKLINLKDLEHGIHKLRK